MRRAHAAGVLVAALAALATAAPALADTKITDGQYVSPISGVANADATLALCSTDNRQQNEPTVAIDPTNAQHMTAGSNDYCTVPSTGDSWGGWYWSSDGGGSWTDSVLPGYPTDTTPQGEAAPAHGFVLSTGDPVQAWDGTGHLYYGVIGFNRVRPANASLYVYRFTWQGGDMPQYDYSTLVQRGTPSPEFLGHFEDKIGIEADRSASSPYGGNVYVCNARFTASGPNNAVYFYRSTDGARTFSNGTKLSESIHGSQDCDIAVTKDGTVYVTWRQFGFRSGQGQSDAVAFAKSTDGGKTFSKPQVAVGFTGWDPGDVSGAPDARAEAERAACLAGDGNEPEACASTQGASTEAQDARDCGDGALGCKSGYVFFRAGTSPRVTADPTSSGNPNEVYVVFDASVPGSETDTGTTYGTEGEGVGSQAAVYFTKTTDGGKNWTTPARIDPQAQGHQFFADVDANGGRLNAMWQDSRFDCASGPNGGDFRTVPIANAWTAQNPPGATACGSGLTTFYAYSTTDGASWTSAEVASDRQMPSYEQFGNRDVPFFGDYNYVSAVGTVAASVWTDQRDTVPGTDPRYPNGDGTDGFDVLQCRADNGDGTFGPDTCPNDGGLDENIYGAIVGP